MQKWATEDLKAMLLVFIRRWRADHAQDTQRPLSSSSPSSPSSSSAKPETTKPPVVTDATPHVTQPDSAHLASKQIAEERDPTTGRAVSPTQRLDYTDRIPPTSNAAQTDGINDRENGQQESILREVTEDVTDNQEVPITPHTGTTQVIGDMQSFLWEQEKLIEAAEFWSLPERPKASPGPWIGESLDSLHLPNQCCETETLLADIRSSWETEASEGLTDQEYQGLEHLSGSEFWQLDQIKDRLFRSAGTERLEILWTAFERCRDDDSYDLRLAADFFSALTESSLAESLKPFKRMPSWETLMREGSGWDIVDKNVQALLATDADAFLGLLTMALEMWSGAECCQIMEPILTDLSDSDWNIIRNQAIGAGRMSPTVHDSELTEIRKYGAEGGGQEREGLGDFSFERTEPEIDDLDPNDETYLSEGTVSDCDILDDDSDTDTDASDFDGIRVIAPLSDDDVKSMQRQAMSALTGFELLGIGQVRKCIDELHGQPLLDAVYQSMDLCTIRGCLPGHGVGHKCNSGEKRRMFRWLKATLSDPELKFETLYDGNETLQPEPVTRVLRAVLETSVRRVKGFFRSNLRPLRSDHCLNILAPGLDALSDEDLQQMECDAFQIFLHRNRPHLV